MRHSIWKRKGCRDDANKHSTLPYSMDRSSSSLVSDSIPETGGSPRELKLRGGGVSSCGTPMVYGVLA